MAIKEIEGAMYTVEYVRNGVLNEYFLLEEKRYFDIELEDIIVTRNFAILLGPNVHKIVYHSIHPDFRTE